MAAFNVTDLPQADAQATAAIIEQGARALPLMTTQHLTQMHAVASSVDLALATIRENAGATPSPETAAFALEIEAFACCLRGQAGNIAAVKASIAAMATADVNIESWTGYSTILSIISKLLRKVVLRRIIITFTTLTPLQISKYASAVRGATILSRSTATESLYQYCCIGRYACLLMSLISRFDASSPLLSFALTPTEIAGVAHAAPLHIFYGAKFGFMYPFKLRTLLKNIIIASASIGSAFDPSSSFKTCMMAALKAPLLLVSSSHRAEGHPSPPTQSKQAAPTTHAPISPPHPLPQFSSPSSTENLLNSLRACGA